MNDDRESFTLKPRGSGVVFIIFNRVYVQKLNVKLPIFNQSWKKAITLNNIELSFECIIKVNISYEIALHHKILHQANGF